MSTSEWSIEAIDAVLEFLPIFENDAFTPFVWPPLQRHVEDGKEITHMPYPIYADEVDQLWKVIGKGGGYIHPYDPLPEDATQDGVPFSVLGAHFPVKYFETATVDQIRRFFTLCCRGERFCDGYIASQFENGCIVAALKRLKQIRLSTASPDG
jgi:hypothetical protein